MSNKKVSKQGMESSGVIPPTPLEIFKMFCASHKIVLLIGVLAAIGIYVGYNSFGSPAWPGMGNITPAAYTEQVLNKHARALQDYKVKQSANPMEKPSDSMFVVADRLNVRSDASKNQEPVGEIVFNQAVKVVDSSNPEWYKVDLNLGQLRVEQDKKLYKYYDANGALVLEAKKQLNPKGDTYVAAQYLSQKANAMAAIPPKDAKNPFVYAILFYNKEKAAMLENFLWEKMSDQLKSLGYDGVKVVMAGKDEDARDAMKSNKFQGMETSAATAYRTVGVDKTAQVFGKLVDKNNAGSPTYSSFILVNKDSKIEKLKDLEGKKVFSGNENSASGYQLPLKALKDSGVNTAKITLYKGFNHAALLPIIANKISMDTESKSVASDGSGVVPDAVFIGDFIMLSSTFDYFNFIKQWGLPTFKNAAELQEMRDKVYILPIKMDDIPECGQVLAKQLYDNEAFRNAIRTNLEEFYNKTNENFGLMEATSAEYEIMKKYEEK